MTGETSAFTGAEPVSSFSNNQELVMFDLTSFGQPDDGFWYYQVTGSVETVQDIATGSNVILYEFTVPPTWSCANCVEILTSDIPGLPISTTSFIDNGGMGVDVLNLVVNMAPLPVEFLSFDARKIGDEVQLDWKVTDEQNVKGYHVQRSADGINWQALGFATFKLSSSVVNNYSMVDQSPLYGISYYRIGQEDIDGKMSYSVIRKIHTTVDAWQVSLYPVPVNEVLNVNIRVNNNGPAVLRITDALGRTIKVLTLQLNQGDQTEKLLLGALKAGMYYIEVKTGVHIWTGKFIKE